MNESTTAICQTAGCNKPVAGALLRCVDCHHHHELMHALARHKPNQANPLNLGNHRVCSNCVWWVRGYRSVSSRKGDPAPFNWVLEDGGEGPKHWGDCRTNPPRVTEIGDGGAFPRVHRDDWCRYHQLRKAQETARASSLAGEVL